MMNILIVEDQWLLSSAVEEAVLSLGHEAIGTATTAKEAYELADKAEVVFVDVNLIDGATGPEIGRRLAADGVTVVFMTGNPEQLGSGVGGALGVISKPVMDLELVETIRSNTQRIIMPGETALLPSALLRFIDRYLARPFYSSRSFSVTLANSWSFSARPGSSSAARITA
ncbi:response regulator [Rhizobium sp. LjRoot30]|uniref:response regulator n=1 Tax=Rhizobium sp. LjRoot30 TaxID=3342320 RepID=UPI003ECD531C